MLAGNEETKTTKARLFNLHPVTASRFAFNAQHDRRGMVVGRERVSGKSGNAQSDVRALQSKNERRAIKQKGHSARECACVWDRGVQILLQKEKEKGGQASKASAGRETNREEARRDGEKEEGHKYKRSRV